MGEQQGRVIKDGKLQIDTTYATGAQNEKPTVRLSLPLPELQQWLKAHDDHLFMEMIRKAVEYGASDFRIMGEALAGLVGEEAVLDHGGWSAQDRQKRGQLMAVAFYMLGKIARMTSAFERGELPNVDSAMDIEQYAKIYQKIAETGRWT